MSESPAPVRSYQRIFRPERRIYSIEGRALPVPGGVPLRWLAYAGGTLVVDLALSGRSTTLALLLAGAAAAAAAGQGGKRGATLGALAGFLAAELGGLILSLLDWPIRLVVLPAAIAALATQSTPDGRTPGRFAYSWLGLRLAPRSSSLGRPLSDGYGGLADLWVAADGRSGRLRRARLRGPCRISITVPSELLERRRRSVIRSLGWRRRRGRVVSALELAAGEAIEVRP